MKNNIASFETKPTFRVISGTQKCKGFQSVVRVYVKQFNPNTGKYFIKFSFDNLGDALKRVDSLLASGRYTEFSTLNN